MSDLGERVLRLERVNQVLVGLLSDKDAGVVEVIENFLDVFVEWDRGYTFDDYEKELFNERRLYEALGKDQARSVLGIWRRFRDVCEFLIQFRKESV